MHVLREHVHSHLCSLSPCRNKTCHFREVVNLDGSSSPALRLCNSFWSRRVHESGVSFCLENPGKNLALLHPLSNLPFPPLQSPNMKTSQDLDHLIFGMASQIAEREDNVVVEDLRGASIGN